MRIPVTDDLEVLEALGHPRRRGKNTLVKSYCCHGNRMRLLIRCDCGSPPRTFWPADWRNGKRIPNGCNVCYSPSVRHAVHRKKLSNTPKAKISTKAMPVQPVYDVSHRVMIYDNWQQAAEALRQNNSLLIPEAESVSL